MDDGHDGSSSESEMEWEEVIDAGAAGAGASTSIAGPSSAGGAAGDSIEVTLKPGTIVASDAARKVNGKGKGRPAGFSAQAALERAYRQELHKVHTGALLVSGHVRNGWLNDKALQARLMSKCPLEKQNAFHNYSKTTHPKATDRSRLFEGAVRDLMKWWHSKFTIEDTKDDESEGLLGILQNPHSIDTLKYEEMQGLLADLSPKDRIRVLMPFADDEALRQLLQAYPDTPKKGRAKETPKASKKTKLPKTLSAILGELIRNPQSLAKRAVTMHGTKDMSVQLFTSLCRALDVPARLVQSVPAVDYRSGNRVKRDETMSALRTGSSKKKRKRTQTRTKSVSDEYDDDDFEEVEVASNLPSKAFRRVAAGGDTSDASSIGPPGGFKKSAASVFASRKGKARSESIDLDEVDESVPTFWTEVYNRSLQEWVAVDVIRNRMRPKKGEMDTGRLFYVVAYEVDQYIKDVTPRYAKSFAGRTLKMRIQSRKKDDPDWWEETLRPWTRPFVLGREQREDQELLKSQEAEPMPTVLEGFKNHPRYVLERHIKREEVIPERTRQLGLFRGEPVYPRSAVIPVKSSETWMREGRRIKQGEQPLKVVKQRAVTINKRRAQEMAEQEGYEAIMQGLYSRSQTELVIPPPIVDGKVPKNSYGNIDLFAPHMLPRGAVHLPFKTAKKVAKELEVDFAEAITGFEFHKRRAVPTVSGIVVAAENEQMVLEAYYASETAAAEKEALKKKERCLKRWKKLIIGLRVRSRIQGEYKKGGKGVAVQASEKQGKSNTTDDEGVSQLAPLGDDESLSQLAPLESGLGNGDLFNLPPMPAPLADPGLSTVDLPPLPRPDVDVNYDPESDSRSRNRTTNTAKDILARSAAVYRSPRKSIQNGSDSDGDSNDGIYNNTDDKIQLDEFVLSKPEEIAEGGVDVGGGGFMREEDEDEQVGSQAESKESEGRVNLKLTLRRNGVKEKDYADAQADSRENKEESEEDDDDDDDDDDDGLEMDEVDVNETVNVNVNASNSVKDKEDAYERSPSPASRPSPPSSKSRTTRTFTAKSGSGKSHISTNPDTSTRRSTRGSVQSIAAPVTTTTTTATATATATTNGRSTRATRSSNKTRSKVDKSSSIATTRPRRASARHSAVIERDSGSD